MPLKLLITITVLVCLFMCVSLFLEVTLCYKFPPESSKHIQICGRTACLDMSKPLISTVTAVQTTGM